MLGTSFVAIFISAAFLDVPSQSLPRGIHEFVLPLGVGAFAAMRQVPASARHGFSIACFAAYAFFVGVNPDWTTEYRVPEAVRSVGVWLDASLGLEVMAEGVETVNHRRLLGDAGCTLFQGDLFSRPVPPAEFGALLRRRSTHVTESTMPTAAAVTG